ncbi:PIN domain-containing protein [Thiobaca trueperi]|uniref:Ribonuclease VapC n=1 Tax=Thiobaca trueperi TaxID=127458 RepID=A0A4R3N789_9GAMM|nr:PIN domain-containing protein [Thiobaca trueperi]TCT22963.1 putative nucleic acid-binding protein [Thiobaca trueperi]
MQGDCFVDTNIWVYAHLDDPNEPRSLRAWDFINSLTKPIISSQVIAEYYNVMLRHEQDEDRIQRNAARMLRACKMQPLNLAVVHRALAVRKRYGFSIWDSQIVAAALEAGCATLYTEDLQEGQIIDGLTVRNPLRI